MSQPTLLAAGYPERDCGLQPQVATNEQPGVKRSEMRPQPPLGGCGQNCAAVFPGLLVPRNPELCAESPLGFAELLRSYRL